MIVPVGERSWAGLLPLREEGSSAGMMSHPRPSGRWVPPGKDAGRSADLGAATKVRRRAGYSSAALLRMAVSSWLVLPSCCGVQVPLLQVKAIQ